MMTLFIMMTAMSLSQLTSQQFYQAMIMGCQSVVLVKEQLNSINIFPVADGDTGDNLASTATAIIDHALEKPSYIEMFQSVANASLLGARGNSGVIFSQFFNGLSLNYCNKPVMNTTDFSDLLVKAADSVRQSIFAPIEGTMLTMIESFANAVSTITQKTTCFNQLMEQVLPHLKLTLSATTNSVPILKKANVVDAGALGFYYFVEGFASSLSGSSLIDHSYPKGLGDKIEHKTMLLETRPSHRYCTEVILKSNAIDKAQLSALLEQQGDCLAFTGHEKACRIHMHTNHPSKFFSSLMGHGTLEYPKVDDMLRQFEVTHERKSSIALVADSSADIPQGLRDEYQVHLIPLNVHMDEHHLLDRYCFDPTLFYQNLVNLKHPPKTSLPSLALIEEKLSFLSQHYEHVLVLSIAQSMSGTFDAMAQIARKYPNVCIIDSRTNSGAHGLLVQYAGELINLGLSFQTIIKKIKEAITETSIFVMVNDVEAMVRSGRINKWVGRIGQVSGLKPIISVDKVGKGAYFATGFNTAHALSKMIKSIQKMQFISGKELAHYCIVHAGVDEKARDFAKRTTAIFQKPPAYIENVSPAIGLHAGEGCIAVAFRLQYTKDVLV